MRYEDKIKISVVGCGYWGNNIIRVLSELGNLASVWDVNEDHLLAVAKQYALPILNFDQIIDSDINAVIIATTADQHYELALRALKAKKHVFVEKPLTLDLEEARKLYKVSVQMGSVLMVGHLLQYHAAFLRMKQLIHENALGRVHHIYAYRLNLGGFRHKENVFWDLASHDVSMILGITDKLPEKIYARGACNYNPLVHDTALVDLSFSNGINAHIFVSWIHPFKEQKLVVVGERGMAIFDDCLPWEEKLKIYTHEINFTNGVVHCSQKDTRTISLEKIEPLKAECLHFIECIKDNKKPRTDGIEGIQVLSVLDMVQQHLTIF